MLIDSRKSLIGSIPNAQNSEQQKKVFTVHCSTYSCFCGAYGIKELAKNQTGKEPGDLELEAEILSQK
jgi:hypothetical protein